MANLDGMAENAMGVGKGLDSNVQVQSFLMNSTDMIRKMNNSVEALHFDTQNCL